MAATTQAPIKVRLETKDNIRYLAAFEDASQAEIVEAAAEYAVRHASEIDRGIARARQALAQWSLTG
jgi:hypothetical protein